jgi:homoserine O-acetyltransferase
MPVAIHRKGLFVCRLLLALTVPAVWAGPASGQVSPVQTCDLGSLALESGAVIPNFRMTYITLGTLNAAKSNAILSIHGLRGNRNSQTTWAGPGRAFDTTRYFVIQPDTLGVVSLDPNATTSPTRSGLNMGFPRFNIRDMVHAEHRMLTECLGIRHLVAVSGTSMGGIESFQWAVSYPDFMDAVIPLVPQAKSNRQGNFIWEAARQVIMADPKWRGGDYPNDDPPRMGAGVGLNVQTAFGSSSRSFEESFATKEEVFASFAAGVATVASSVQPRDWIYRTWAIDSHHIGETPGFNGDLAAAARAIQARVLLFPNCFDQLLPPRESGVFEAAEHIRTVKLVNLDHMAGHGGTGAQQALITTQVRDLLDRIDRGRPGIRGPRFPNGSTRADYCSPGGFSSAGGDEDEDD